MAETMKGVIVSEVGGSYEIVSNLDKPKPGPGQVLVKSIVTGINPVDPFMKGTGVLVTSWPIVLGCDASGEVVEVGEGVTKFIVGDGVFGCTRLGIPRYSTFQEYFLMDEKLAFKRPAKVTLLQAATIGVGVLTACLGLISGTQVEFSPKDVDDTSKWLIVLGGAGAVGQFAIQIGKLCGYKVLASCSPSNDNLVKSLGADATLNYRTPLENQIREIGTITGGRFSKAFDASAMATETALTALSTFSDPDGEQKYFTTTNDWEPIESKEGIQIEKVKLGDIGRDGDAEVDKINKDILRFIPQVEKLLESGALKPMEYDFIEGNDFDPVLKGLEAFQTRKSDGKKLVVRIAKE